MAVTALPRSQATTTHRVRGVHPAILVACLVVPALDLLAVVQTHASLAGVCLAWCGLASVLLGAAWLRHPREAWLASAALSMAASGALRLIGAPEAAALSLLAIVALGIGGAFAAQGLELEAVLADSEV